MDNVSKLEIEWTFLNLVKDVDKKTLQLMVKMEYLHVFLEIMNKERMSSLTSPMQCCPIGPNWCSKQEKEIKSLQTGKEEVKVSLIADDIIIYIENPRNL